MITVAIPVRDQGDLLAVVLEKLRCESAGLRTLIFDNGSSEETIAIIEAIAEDWPGSIEVRHTPGRSLYQMWNDAIANADAYAQQFRLQEWEVALLNSDIDFECGTMHVLATAMRQRPGYALVCPDYDRRVTEGIGSPEGPWWPLRVVRGSYRHGGLAGWCFMAAGEKLAELGPRAVDEQFEIWYGDDDLFFAVEKLGYGLGIVEGLPIDHVGEATVSQFPELHAAKERDAARFEAKWGSR